MITIDNVFYRNLQEQVQKNKSDIEAWTNVQFTLNNMGITVLGRVNTSLDIPDNTYEYGDAYLVGTVEPYNIYIYTRTTDPSVTGTFINLGPLSIAGPQGIQGVPGKDGEDGYAPVVRYGSGLPVIMSTDKNGYLYVDTDNSNLYTFNNGWKFVVSMKGDKGDQGIQGNQGATGTTLSIVGKLASESLLPTNFSSGTILKNSAYLVAKDGGNHLYIIMGDQNDYNTWYWQDVGDFNLGSVVYKDNTFQYSINVVDTYNTSTGSVVTDNATNSLYNTLNSVIEGVNSDVNNLSNNIGNLNNLETENKSNIVSAINEVKNSAGSGSGGGKTLLYEGELDLSSQQVFPSINIAGYDTYFIEAKIKNSNPTIFAKGYGYFITSIDDVDSDFNVKLITFMLTSANPDSFAAIQFSLRAQIDTQISTSTNAGLEFHDGSGGVPYIQILDGEVVGKGFQNLIITKIYGVN